VFSMVNSISLKPYTSDVSMAQTPQSHSTPPARL
jgi:hypothetical protein